MDNTTYFAVIWAIITFLAPYYLRKSQSRSEIANNIVTFGVLGTFIGVFVGLLYFDVNNISGSVPKLLAGLKLAFLTSIVGMMAALILKVRPSIYKIQIPKTNSLKADSKADAIIESLNKIEKAIAGDSENTLFTQIQKLRITSADGFASLNSSFTEFAEKVVADSTQSLIDALQTVISDFNAKISEQFGENFKQLNDAVGKMLEWQKEYSSRIELMTEQFNRTLEGSQKSVTVLEEITKKAGKFSDTADRLEQLLAAMGITITSIESISKSAKEGFPKIEKSLEDMTTNFSAAVNNAVKLNSEMIGNQKAAIDTQLNVLSRAHNDFQEKQNKYNSDATIRLQRMVDDQASNITKQLQLLDEQLGKELNQALETLGSQLASLSRQFVNDYDPLTKKLQELVGFAGGRGN